MNQSFQDSSTKIDAQPCRSAGWLADPSFRRRAAIERVPGCVTATVLN
jgi:hypothetical protein